jgi:cytochrome c peroxidase
LPDTSILCARCHTASAAKPKGFPQVVPSDHSNGMPCNSCHQPHNPGMDAPANDAAAKAAGGAK